MVRFEQFSKSYGRRIAVHPLDLTVERGEVFALLGPNGGGKTTILRALVGLHAPTQGRIYVDETDIQKDPVKVKKVVSYLPQRVSAPERLTAREVLTLHAGLKRIPVSRVDDVLEMVSLEEDADRYLREFSGGMLQRLGLAIAFLSDMKLLVMDEPTLNLDPPGIELFRRLVREVKRKNVTVVLSSHIMQDAAQLADRVGIIVGGRLVKIESIERFRESLSVETQVRIVLNTTENGVIHEAMKSGARDAFYKGRNFIFKALPEKRLAVIRAIENAGITVEEVHTDPPNWETLISRHFNQNGDEHEVQ
jgi:ABC-type multidrug transport system ATPase subunit